MPKAIRIHAPGGPEVLRWEDQPTPRPGRGEVALRQSFVGLNYIDVYHRTGQYPVPALPFTPGLEGAGTVTALGEGVTGLSIGQRVAYAGGTIGAYAEERVIAADRLVPLPAGITDRTAASIMLKGMTAQYLLRQTIQIEPGDRVLIHAAAGGVGLIAGQWARHLGATVIGTVSSDEKAHLAIANGYHHAIVYTRENFVERVRDLTDGAGVRAVYDSVGKDTFAGSLACLSPRGMLVLFGQSSGAVPPFDLALLAKSSLFVTRPTLFAYTASVAELRRTAAELFAVVEEGAVKVSTPQTFPLQEAAAAHRALEARQTTGSTVLETGSGVA